MKCNYKNRKTNIVIFDKPYSKEETAEGLAIQQAVITGECNMCKYKNECENNRNFVFPENAACMKRKQRILKK